MSINPFLNSERQLRNGWWIFIFFLVLAAILVPALIAARQNSMDVSIGLQAVIVMFTSWIYQLMRRKPLAELLGKFNLRWLKELGLRGLIGSALMLAPRSSFGFWAGFIGNGIPLASRPYCQL